MSRKVDYHAEGKWLIHGPTRRKENQLLSLKHKWYFAYSHMHFVQWGRFIFDYILTEILSWLSNWQQFNIGVGNG